MLELLIDNRVGNKTKYYFGYPNELLMQIPDEIRKCVVFVCCKTNTGMVFLGTAFFVAEIFDRDNDILGSFVHLVTAKHVIEGLKKRSIDDTVYLRINTKDNNSGFITTHAKQWLYHPEDKSADVAVLAGMPMNRIPSIDFNVFPVAAFVTDSVIKKYGIGIGDDVFLSGLFVNHVGQKKNIPIIRTGNIAAMPEEPILTDNGLTDAYLIESRSIGGLSGSPVFVHLGSLRLTGEKWSEAYFPSDVGGVFYLLGVIQGHWDIPIQEDDMFIIDDSNKEAVNMGIAIVTPATKILDIINQPSVVADKEVKMKKRKEKRMPKMDSIEEGITKDQFYAILDKAAQPIKKPESNKNEQI